MTTYTDIFGGSTIYPSDVSHMALGLSGDVSLSWPLDANLSETIAARIIDVTPTADGFSIALPDATQVSPGQTVLFNNVSGADSFFVTDAAGGVLATVEAGTQWQLYLALNTTAAGTWRVFRFGASTADVQPSALAGFGLVPTGSTLSVAVPVTTFSTSGLTVATSNRGGAMVWTGSGSGTLNMLSAAAAGNNFFLAVRNSGGGDLTLDPSGSETINGSTTLALRPGDSVQLITNGTAWYTIGLGQEAEFAFDYTSISVTTGTHTLAGSELNRIAYKFVGTLTGNVTVIVPATIQQYWINNATTGAYTLSFKTASGSPVQVNQGARGIYYCDGTEFILADTASISLPISIAQGGTGATTASAARLSLGVSAFADAIVTAANGATVRTVIGAAASGANTDITSLALALGSAAAPSLSFTGDTNTGIFSPGANRMAIATNGVSRLEVGSDGETYFFGSATNRPSIIAQNSTADTSPGYFSFQKSRGASIVQNGDDLGLLGGQGYDGVNYLYGAWIRFQVNGVPGVNDMPGKIGFAVTADGASVPVERMALTSNGLGVGITPPSSAVLRHSVGGDLMLAGASRVLALNLYFDSAWKYGANGYGWGIAETSGSLAFLNAPNNAGGAGAAATTTEAMRISQSGNVGIGITPAERLDVSNAARIRWALGTPLVVTEFATNPAAGAYATARRDALAHEFYLSGSLGFTFNNAGNLVYGGSSPAWAAGGNIVLPDTGVLSYVGPGGYVVTNVYYNAGWKNTGTGGGAMYMQAAGEHVWHNVLSGSAGSAATINERMRLEANGNLSLNAGALSLASLTNFYITPVGGAGNPAINWDANDYLDYDRTNNAFRVAVGGVIKLHVDSTMVRPGVDNVVSLGDPSYRWQTVYAAAVAAASATLSGALNAASAALSGALTAASATLSGALTAASASISGALSAASGSISGAFSIGTLSLTNDLAVTHGGTGASSASAARTNLGAQAQTVYTTDANGYCVATDVGGGVTHKHQWGRITVPANSAATITFPEAFTDAASVSCSGNGSVNLAPGAQDNNPMVYAVSTTTASVYNANDGPVTFFWTADGI